MGKYGLLTERDSSERDKSKAPRCYTFRGFTFIRLRDSSPNHLIIKSILRLMRVLLSLYHLLFLT